MYIEEVIPSSKMCTRCVRKFIPIFGQREPYSS